MMMMRTKYFDLMREVDVIRRNYTRKIRMWSTLLRLPKKCGSRGPQHMCMYALMLQVPAGTVRGTDIGTIQS